MYANDFPLGTRLDSNQVYANDFPLGTRLDSNQVYANDFPFILYLYLICMHIRVDQGASDCYHPASKKKGCGRRLRHQRHLSDSYLECGDGVPSLSDICPTSPC